MHKFSYIKKVQFIIILFLLIINKAIITPRKNLKNQRVSPYFCFQILKNSVNKLFVINLKEEKVTVEKFVREKNIG